MSQFERARRQRSALSDGKNARVVVVYSDDDRDQVRFDVVGLTPQFCLS